MLDKKEMIIFCVLLAVICFGFVLADMFLDADYLTSTMKSL